MHGYGREASPIPHGRKRPADDNLESEQRLSKRFNLLNLGYILIIPQHKHSTNALAEHHGKLYIPVQSNTPIRSSGQNDSMQLDDTKDKVYIHDLAAELADVQSDEEYPLFLPDIEKKLSKIPRSVLMSSNPPITNNQMILYNVPSSLSVPKEQDNVRRAIIDSRARSMEKQAEGRSEGQETESSNSHSGNSIGHAEDRNATATASTEDMEIDDNAMDIE
ncbi:MAG: hypothetical protein LQ352_007839 [Teloschistes flavicans]|nr:MAG: hypothetical protein LQ352_007839 [Teloschistes flavicans]